MVTQLEALCLVAQQSHSIRFTITSIYMYILRLSARIYNMTELRVHYMVGHGGWGEAAHLPAVFAGNVLANCSPVTAVTRGCQLQILMAWLQHQPGH